MVPSIRFILTNVHWISDHYNKNHFGLNLFFCIYKRAFYNTIYGREGFILFAHQFLGSARKCGWNIQKNVCLSFNASLFQETCGIVTVSFRILDWFKYNLKKMYILYSLHMLLSASKGDVRMWLHHLDCLHNEWVKAKMCDVSKRAWFPNKCTFLNSII